MKICNECETVAHCTKHGCIPKVSAKDAIKLALGHDAMRSALNALEARCGTNAEERGPTGAITLLNTALAEQPAQQERQEKAIEIAQAFSRGHDAGWESATAHHKALTPQPAQQQEPVAWWDANLGVFDEKYFDQLQPLYTSPQPPEQRKPLTDEEMYLAIRPLFRTDALANAALKISKDEYQAIEAAIRARGSNT